MKRKIHRKKKPSIRRLALNAWKLMSLISRQKDADRDGYVSCVTCGARKHWKDVDAGHFFHGSKQRPISYDHRNIHAQCWQCNHFKGGARDWYACYVAKRYGSDTLGELMTLKHSGAELKRNELESIIDGLKEKYAKLVKD